MAQKTQVAVDRMGPGSSRRWKKSGTSASSVGRTRPNCTLLHNFHAKILRELEVLRCAKTAFVTFRMQGVLLPRWHSTTAHWGWRKSTCLAQISLAAESQVKNKCLMKKSASLVAAMAQPAPPSRVAMGAPLVGLSLTPLALLLGARRLLGAPSLSTRSKDAARGSWQRY